MADTTITTAQNSFLTASAVYKEWEKNFMLDWFKPQLEMQMLLTIEKLKKLPEEIQRELEAQAPEAWKEIMSNGSNRRT